MEDSASDIAARREAVDTETLWVWIKPAAFYNVIESRYQQNKYLLRRCLSYGYKAPKREEVKEAELEVEFLDVGQNLGSAQKKQPVMRLSVIAAACEQLSERVRRFRARLAQEAECQEFLPLTVKCVHLRGHDTVCVKFGVEHGDLTLLLLVRGSHHDLSLLHKGRHQPLSPDLTKEGCFGVLSVGEFVWWCAHPVRKSTSKIRVSHWKQGVITMGEKSVWDGHLERQTEMLNLEPPMESTLALTRTPYIFSISVTLTPLSPRVETVGRRERPMTSTEGEVAFRFVYGVTQPQCVEQRTQNFGCPFCTVKSASHDLFLYEVETGTLTVIWVRRRMDVFDERGEIFCPVTKQLIHSLEKAFYMNKAAFLRAKPVTKRRRISTAVQLNDLLEAVDMTRGARKRSVVSSKSSTSKGPSRSTLGRQQRTDAMHLSRRIWRFYHSKTAVPMTETEVHGGIDTDEEDSVMNWEIRTRRQLALLPGASSNQIDFMFLWDQFMHDHVWPYADFKIPMACQLFIWKEYEALQDPQFQRQCLKHLHALFMFKLIQAEDVDSCVSILRDPEEGQKLKVAALEHQLGYSQIQSDRRRTEAALAKCHQDTC